MKNHFIHPLMLLLLGIALISFSCSTVPVEVVELSYRIGEDISEIQKSYLQLIHDHFELLRQERLNYLNNEWVPRFINEWIKDGRLTEIASGSVVWSPEQRAFVSPTAGEESKQLSNTIAFWSQAAMGQITKKRAVLLDSLDIQEAQLSSLVSDAFSRIYRGNSIITAHLNSLKHVQDVQDSLLDAFSVKDLRNKISNSLANISEKAKTGLDKIKQADGFINNVRNNLTDIKNLKN